jgi:hypothetical protein
MRPSGRACGNNPASGLHGPSTAVPYRMFGPESAHAHRPTRQSMKPAMT